MMGLAFSNIYLLQRMDRETRCEILSQKFPEEFLEMLDQINSISH